MYAAGTPKLVRLLLATAIVASVAVLARTLGFVSPVPAIFDNAYYAVELLACVICALRAACSSGIERAAWAVLAVGLLGYFAADVYWLVALADVASPPYPSWSDAGYISIYPAAYIALVLLLRARAGRISPALWLDGLVCALAVAALGAALVIGVVASTDGPAARPSRRTSRIHSATWRCSRSSQRSSRSRAAAPAGRGGSSPPGFGVFAIADAIYLYEVAIDGYRENTILDAGWPAVFLLLAFAAWQPARRLDARRLRGAGMLALPTGAGVVAIGILVTDHYARQNDLAVWLASAALGVIVVRFALTFRENLRMLQASEAGRDDRRADRARQPPRARRGPDDGRGRAGPRAVRSRRLQVLQRHVRAPAGDALLERLGRSLVATLGDAGRAYRMGGDEFCVIAPAGPHDAALIMDAADALTERGGSFDIGCSYGLVRLDAGGDVVDALQTADRRLYENKRSRRAGTAESVHRVLMGVVGEHDGELHHHVVGVARLAERVGREMGLGAADLVHVRRAAALHDIGKIAIPDDILHAPRPLTEDEWQYMRQHTVIGERIISAAPELAPSPRSCAPATSAGTAVGYPDGLAAQDIPLGARIVAVCDSWEAMTSSRAYRAAMSPTLAHARADALLGHSVRPARSSRPSSPCVRRPPTSTSPVRRCPRRPPPRSRRSAPAPPGRRSRRRP